MTDPDVTTLTHRLALLTRRAMGERMATEDWAHVLGFRPGCIGVLQVVAAAGPLSQRQVSDALMMDPSDVVGLVDILEKASLIVRERDQADRRRYALNITTKGQLAVVRLGEVAREAGEAVLAPLDADERAQLATLLRRVVEHHAGGLLRDQTPVLPGKLGPPEEHLPDRPASPVGPPREQLGS